MPAGRPLSATLRDAPVAAVTVARVAPGSESIVSEPRSPTDVQPRGPALQVAREDRERRKLRRGWISRGSKASTARRWRPLSPAASSGSPGLEMTASSQLGSVEPPRRAAIDAQRAQVDAGDEVVALGRAAHGGLPRAVPATAPPGSRGGATSTTAGAGGRPSRREPAVEHDEVARERVAAGGRSRACAARGSPRAPQRVPARAAWRWRDRRRA